MHLGELGLSYFVPGWLEPLRFRACYCQTWCRGWALTDMTPGRWRL